MRNVNKNTHTTHGKSKTKTHIAWLNMRARCNNPKDKGYKNYGDKGIRVCKEWQNSFETFFRDMGEPPSSQHSIERIDCKGHYCPDNCKWATSHEQTRNYSKNVFIEYAGKRQCLTDWANEVGLSKYVLGYRIKKGWPVHEILFTPASISSSIKKL